jgi:hypothetical protein
VVATGAELLARDLDSGVPEARLRACLAIGAERSIPVEVARALLRLVETDEGTVVEWGCDAAGDPRDETLHVRDVAASALEKHATAHLALVSEAIERAAPPIRARLATALPSDGPWDIPLALTHDPDRSVRLAAYRKLRQATTRLPTRYTPRNEVEDPTEAELERFAPVHRALLLGVLDPDRDIVHELAVQAPDPSADRIPFFRIVPLPARRPSVALVRAADVILRDAPEVVARLFARLDEPDDVVAGHVAGTLGWFRDPRVAEALAAAIVRRGRGFFASRAAAALLVQGPVLTAPTLDALVDAVARGALDPVCDALVHALGGYGPRAAAAAHAIVRERFERQRHEHGSGSIADLARIAQSLGALARGLPDVRETLVAMLRTGPPLVAAMAAVALGEMRAHADHLAPHLDEALRGERTERTIGALVATSRLPTETTVALLPSIVALLGPWDPEPREPLGRMLAHRVREAACAALIAMGRAAAPAAAALLPLLEDRALSVAAIYALEAMAPLPDALRAPLAAVAPRAIDGWVITQHRLDALFSRARS